MATIAHQPVVRGAQFSRPAVGLRSRRGVSVTRRSQKGHSTTIRAVFTGDQGDMGGNSGGDMEAPHGDLNAEDLRKEAVKRMRREAALRTARAANGEARAECLRIGLEQRSTYTPVSYTHLTLPTIPLV